MVLHHHVTQFFTSSSLDNHTTMSSTANNNDDDELARQAAQARRQKILETSQDRMNQVSGIPSPEPSSGASKMAAMRRRRFPKKKKEAVEEKDAAAVVVEDKAADPVVEEDKAAAAAPVVEEKPKEAVDDKPPVVDTAEPTEEDEPKKKYMGVAKMRRKMLKEKQQQQQSIDDEPVIVTKTTTTQPSRGPILLHALTVFLLFVAGLEVGLHQREYDYTASSSLVVHKTLAPRHELKLITRFTQSPSPVLVDEVVEEDDLVLDTTPDDEFAEHRPVGADNLDPLFGVDLDRLTEGSGLYYTAARFAVFCHRLNLSLFYYLPLRMVNGIWSTITSFGEQPPILMLLALILRQLVSKRLFRAHLPQLTHKPAQQDVLTMVKNFVSKFVGQAFPSAVSLYETWVHLRADMYVVLCGLFVGMAWSHRNDDLWMESNEVPTVMEEDVVSMTTDEL